MGSKKKGAAAVPSQRAAVSVRAVLNNGTSMEVIAEKQRGDFAVHLQVTGGVAALPGWAVTHVPSGVAIWKVWSYEEAVQVLDWLCAQELAFPPTADAMDVWRVVHAERREALRAALARVAPAYAREPAGVSDGWCADPAGPVS